MARPRSVLIATTCAALGALVLTSLPASAAPPGPPGPRPLPVREDGGPESAAARLPRAPVAAEPVAALRADAGYPRRTALTVPPVDPADRSLKLGLAPYHALAPRLNALQRVGDRVSVEVAGRSAGGHELYLVTVTAPESASQAREQERMRERIENAPAAAAKDPRIKAAYKTPVFINNNIHGNEWEGTDAALKLIEELARATDRKTAGLLAHTRIYLNVTANPDGRIAGTRANADGFDLNRDFVTASQPEARAIRRIAIDKQPAVMLDLHGYVNGTLIEPTTPPHGENYEYDLFLKNSYANALGMEKAVNGLGYTPAKDGVEPAVIPFRDMPEGWDDWPPIFTPQYMPFQGAVAAHTIEFPMAVNNEEYDTLPVTELRRRSAINVAVAGAAMRAALDYTDAHRASVLADQIETFRRAAAGEPQRPVSEKTVPGVPGIGPEDVYTTTFPRAYVIPAGRSQRSAVAAARLVDHLVANDVRVGRAKDGSYVVDLRQPKRGIANVILADGRDISADVSTMYDISGWSLGLLWGATVRRVERGPVPAVVRTVHAAAPTGSVAPHGDLLLRLDDPKELVAVNALLARGGRGAPDGGRGGGRAGFGAQGRPGARGAVRGGVPGHEGAGRGAAGADPGGGLGVGGRAVRAAGDGLRGGAGLGGAPERGLPLGGRGRAVRVARAGLGGAVPGGAGGAAGEPGGRGRRRGGRGRVQRGGGAAGGHGRRGQRGRERSGGGPRRGLPADLGRPGARLRLRAAVVHRARGGGADGPVVRAGRAAGLGALAGRGGRPGRSGGRGRAGRGGQRPGRVRRAGGADRHRAAVP
ncbi:hypothetical protein GCM10019017_55010 [Streptomyces showdoensis]